jgi:hypothetical protein
VVRNASSDDRADPPLTDLRYHNYARVWPQLSNQLIALRWSVEDLKLAQAAYALSVELFGTMVRANEAPFLSHTVGTGSILAVHGAPPTIVCGGLLHAGYTHGLYGTPPNKPLDRAHRVALAQRVSPEVELIVRNCRRYRPADMPVPGDASGYDQDHAAVLLVRAANHLEEHLDCGLVYANKMQKQGNEVMQHARVLLPSLGYHRLLADLESAERLMADIKPAPTELTPTQIKPRSASR